MDAQFDPVGWGGLTPPDRSHPLCGCNRGGGSLCSVLLILEVSNASAVVPGPPGVLPVVKHPAAPLEGQHLSLKTPGGHWSAGHSTPQHTRVTLQPPWEASQCQHPAQGAGIS